MGRKRGLNKNILNSWSLCRSEIIQKHLIENNDLLYGLDDQGNSKIV
jgi:hypothetical protein